MLPVPHDLHGRVFSAGEARAVGVTPAMLRGRRFRRIFRDVFVTRDTVLTERLWLEAALRAAPRDAVVSHTSALRLRGAPVGPMFPLHLSTNTSAQTRDPRVVLHRRMGRLHPQLVDGLPSVGPDRAYVDSATILRVRDLVIAGDALLHLGHTTQETLAEYCFDRHLDGVRRARRAVRLVRPGVESPRETVVRLLLVFARLPEPLPNRDILDAHGRFIARGDLVYLQYRVVVEYDGWHHERDAAQRQRDHLRREELEAAGWRVIVITAQDLKEPRRIPLRVHAALRERGYRGPGPVTSVQWPRWAA